MVLAAPGAGLPGSPSSAVGRGCCQAWQSRLGSRHSSRGGAAFPPGALRHAAQSMLSSLPTEAPMKTLLVIAALAAVSPLAPTDKPAPLVKTAEDLQASPARDQRLLPRRLHWDSMRQQVNPAAPSKDRSGPEIR